MLMLCHRFTSNNQVDRSLIEQAILNGRLNVHPELQKTGLSEAESASSPEALASPIGQLAHQEQAEKRTLISIRSDIKSALRQIVDQERIESQLIEKQYQQKNAFGKAQAQISSFGKGLYGAGESFLTWMKDVNDVLSLSQRLWRVMKAAAAADSANEGQRYQVFQQTLADSEKKELVEALGFDPAKISVDKFKQAFELANLIYDDHLTQIILTQFVKDYADAQHSLEWSEFSGGAAFEVILTALLALATGGVGAIASLGAQARKISQLKKLGKLFSELAEALKNIPKGKKLILRKLKEVEDKKGKKSQTERKEPKPEEKNKSTLSNRKGKPPQSLGDAADRLKSMRAEIKANGYKSKYSDNELVAMGASGKVANERYQVRFMESSYLADRNTPDDSLSGKMGGPFKGKSGDGVKYWSTSFDQLEDADSDPKLIAEKVGIKYNPQQDYALVIVDNYKAAQISGTHAITPTFKDLGDFAKKELPDQFDASTIDELYTAEYQKKYNQLYGEADELGMDVWSKKGMEDFTDLLENRGDNSELFEQRVTLHRKLGSNEDFLGNGLTKNLIKKTDNKYGVVETFTFEHTPQNLAALKESGAITVIETLKPIGIN